MGYLARAAAGSADEARTPPVSGPIVDLDMEPGGVEPPRMATVGGRGIGVTDAAGRILWVDDGFCRVVGSSRTEVLDAGMAQVLGLGPDGVAGSALTGDLVRLPEKGPAVVVRVTPLGPGDVPWAFVVSVAGGAVPDPAVGPASVLAAFVVDGNGNVTAGWGRAEELAGLEATGRRRAGLARGAAPFSELVQMALDGMATTGVLLVGDMPRNVRLFPVRHPDQGRPGAVGVIAILSPRVFPVAVGPSDRLAALADLARYALAGAPRELLLEEAARLVRGALDAEACAIFEHHPKRRGRHRAASSPPDNPEPATAAAGYRAGTRTRRSLTVTIEGPPTAGVLAVHLGGERRFDAAEESFVADVADILAVALRRMAGDENQRRTARHDALTGLPNRAVILDHLRLALARAERQPAPVALIFMDLARFKVVNDTLGHDTGDALLVAVANRLLGVLRPSDTLGRLGGDEFLIVCEDLGGAEDALAVADRLAGAFLRPFTLGGRAVHARATIGLALSELGTEPATLLASADAAMYQAKIAGDDRPVLFQERMRPGADGITGRQPGEETRAGMVPVGGHPPSLVSRLAGILEELGDADLIRDATGPTDLDEPAPTLC